MNKLLNVYTYSVLTKGETVLSTNEPNPSLYFLVMLRMAVAGEIKKVTHITQEQYNHFFFKEAMLQGETVH